ncbi:MAG TPA: hypothetical protein VM095_01040 [Pyrinomonadaceae bacterium]|nr:hypothetical protein [Pyrinomonadaceae bacterium]
MKKASRFKLLPLVLIYVCSLLFMPTAFAGKQNDKIETIRQARRAYYSLSRLGLVGFESKIQPNWQLALKAQLAANPSGAQEGLKILNGLHFSMLLDQQGNVKVNHSSDSPAPNEQVATGFNQIYQGIEQVVTGFYMTWNLFMLQTPFPEDSAGYQLQDLGNHYLLSYKDKADEVFMTMTKELVITELKVSSPQFKGLINPHFIKTPKGYVLTGYEGNFEPATGPGKTQLSVKLDYQEVNGLQLPHKLFIDSSYDGEATQVELLFSDYKIKTR